MYIYIYLCGIFIQIDLVLYVIYCVYVYICLFLYNAFLYM